MTGTVVWGCDIGVSQVVCYKDGKEIAIRGPFNFDDALPEDIVALLVELAGSCADASAAEGVCEALRQVVFSAHGMVPKDPAITFASERGVARLGRTTEEEARRRERSEAPQGLAWLSVGKVQDILRSPERSLPAPLSQAELRAPIVNDVMLGAEALVAAPEELAAFAAQPPVEVQRWEWSQLVGRTWRRLPPYVSGVIEGAFRSGARFAGVQLGQSLVFAVESDYIVADLKHFQVGMGRRDRENEHSGMSEAARYKLFKDRRKLTRFPVGKFSSIPDRRLPPPDALFVATGTLELYGEDTATQHARFLAEENLETSSMLFEQIPETVRGEHVDLAPLSDRVQDFVAGASRDFFGVVGEDTTTGSDSEDSGGENPLWPRHYRFVSGTARTAGNVDDIEWDLCTFVQRADLTPGTGAGRLLCCALERIGCRRASQLKELRYADFERALPGSNDPELRERRRELLAQIETSGETWWTAATEKERQAAADAGDALKKTLKQIEMSPECLRLQAIRLAVELFWTKSRLRLPAALDAAYCELELLYDKDFRNPWDDPDSDSVDEG